MFSDLVSTFQSNGCGKRCDPDSLKGAPNSGPETPMGPDRKFHHAPVLHFGSCHDDRWDDDESKAATQNNLGDGHNHGLGRYVLVPHLNETTDVHRSLLVVFDEETTAEGASFLAHRLPQILSAHPGLKSAEGLENRKEIEVVEEALRDSIDTIDEELHNLSEQGSHLGSVMCILLIGKMIYLAGFGDAHAYIYREGAILHLLQNTNKVENGTKRSKNSNGMVAQRLTITNEPLRSTKDAFLMLGSNALFDSISPANAASVVRRVISQSRPNKEMADAAAETLISKAQQHSSKRDLSSAIILFEW